MLIDPKICRIEAKTMIGLSITTTQRQIEETQILWKSFIPKSKSIEQIKSDNLYSIQIYPKNVTFRTFSDGMSFQKWAAVEVEPDCPVPKGMKLLNIPKGEYAIFIHHGPATNFPKTAQYIFGMWLPNSIYEFDYRPQFEIMEPDYLGPNHPDSQEQVWIPIKKKANY